jgi:hypothetical protein
VGNRTAIYLRVSKGERHTENQRPDVERLIATRGLDVVAEYEEKASAAKTRLVFDRMMADAHRGAFDVLVVWALDRFGRSMVGNLRDVLELDRCGVQVVSVRETWLDTGSAVRPLLIAIPLPPVRCRSPWCLDARARWPVRAGPSAPIRAASNRGDRSAVPRPGPPRARRGDHRAAVYHLGPRTRPATPCATWD